jgi:probable selenate reductase FAD-binding subunit
MIVEYHRPETLGDALALLSRPQPATLPLGGGTVLSQPGGEKVAVVDLQALGLNAIQQQGNTLRIGATATLQQVFESSAVPDALCKAAHREDSLNLRQMATLGGALVCADGRSALATVLMAMDAKLKWLPGEQEVSLGDWMPLRGTRAPGKLIAEISLPVAVQAGFETVARSPDDLPQVIVAVAQWPSGRTRIAVGGFGPAPMLAMDGTEPGGAADAVANAFSQAGDAWASAEYRKAAGIILVGRLLNKAEER